MPPRPPPAGAPTRPATPPPLAFARHVVLGDAGAATLARAGARDLVVLRDLLSIGPCAPVPARHAALRRAFWRSFLADLYPGALKATPPERSVFGAHELARALARAPARRVVMWTAPRWTERLALAFAAEPLAGHGDVWLATAGPLGAGGADPGALARALARARRPGAELDALGALWRAYVAPTPAGMPAALHRAGRRLPDVPRVARAYLGLFPRLRGGRLYPSPLDRLLLAGHASPETLVGVLARAPRVSRLFLRALGDLVLDVRRHAWRDAGALEIAVDDPLPSRRKLRLTERGASLLEAGLDRPADAPALFAGGHRIYGPRTWVVAGGRLQRRHASETT
jgi:hypothetical protein